MKGIPNQQRLLQQILEERDKITQGKEKELLLAYQLVFHSEHGKMVLQDLKNSYTGISLTPGYPDVTAFREGRRSVIDDIETVLNMAKAILTPPPTPRR